MIERDDDSERVPDRTAQNQKRKGPIVNRKGPSEVSRAIQMLGSQNGRAVGSGRKPGGASASRGTVIRLDRSKGFGFLVDSSGEQRFFHRTAVLNGGFDSLQEQQTVDFEPYTDERGARAQKVRPAGTPSNRDRGDRPSPKASPKTPKPSTWKSDLSPFRSGSGAPTIRKRPLI